MATTKTNRRDASAGRIAWLTARLMGLFVLSAIIGACSRSGEPGGQSPTIAITPPLPLPVVSPTSDVALAPTASAPTAGTPEPATTAGAVVSSTAETAATATAATATASPGDDAASEGACPSRRTANGVWADTRSLAVRSGLAQQGAVDVSYDEAEDTIFVRGDGRTTLRSLARELDDEDLLRDLGGGQWMLSANLMVEDGAALRVAGPEVRHLKLRSDADGYVWLRVFGGRLDIEDTRVTSWDPAKDAVDEEVGDGRSYILARDGAEMNVRRAETSYLGFDADESFGLSWRMEGTTGELVDSCVAYNYYGMYSFEVEPGLVIRGNEVHHNVLYGIDPHDRSNELVIEDNEAHDNGADGIILAEGCSDSRIRNNRSYNNKEHGFVLYQGSNGNLVEGNIAYRNGLSGINVNDAAENTIRNNTVYENGASGISVGKGSAKNLIVGNGVRANEGDGIEFYSAAERNRAIQNTVNENEGWGIYAKSKTSGNVIAPNNQVFNNGKGKINDDQE